MIIIDTFFFPVLFYLFILYFGDFFSLRVEFNFWWIIFILNII